MAANRKCVMVLLIIKIDMFSEIFDHTFVAVLEGVFRKRMNQFHLTLMQLKKIWWNLLTGGFDLSGTIYINISPPNNKYWCVLRRHVRFWLKGGLSFRSNTLYIIYYNNCNSKWIGINRGLRMYLLIGLDKHYT